MSKASVTLTVNGRAVSLDVAPRTHLADALREDLGLTGTHLGCEQGVCGACTMMIDGAPQRGCLTLAASCEGASVTTIEGFDDDPIMAGLRESFSAHHGLQCGYCTPGMLVTAHDIIRRLPDADEPGIRQELAGNLCRCTGYVGIVQAIQSALAAFPPDHPLRQAQPLQRETLEALRVDPVARRTEPATTTVQRSIAAGPDEKIHHRLDLDFSPLDLWAKLTDIETVAACFPGAKLLEIERHDDPDGPHQLRGQLAVSLGPMKARFEGRGEVRFSSIDHRGRLSGEGEDRGSRSRANGIVNFEIEPRGEVSRLHLSIAHNVTGPLAQFSRAALVNDLVSTMLQAFGDNIARTADGRSAEIGGELKATTLLSSLLRQRVSRWFDALRSLFRH